MQLTTHAHDFTRCFVRYTHYTLGKAGDAVVRLKHYET